MRPTGAPAAMMMSPGQPLSQQQATSVTIVTQAPAVVSRPSVLSGYAHRQSVVVGVVLIIVASLSVTCNAVGLVKTINTLQPLGYFNAVAFACHGFWCGFLVSTSSPRY